MGQVGGAGLRIASAISKIEGRWNGFRPVRSSNSTTPKAKMSERTSAKPPRSSSGAMYPGVPNTVPAMVNEVANFAVSSSVFCPGIFLARPKSSTLTVKSGRSLMLAGLRSRWMTPASCAYSSAAASCSAMYMTCSYGIGPRARASASVGPSTSSMINARPPLASSTP